MNIRIQISSHAVNVSRSWYPRAHGCAPFGTLNLGDSMVLFHATGEIDAVIAELVALRAEMDGPPAINGDRHPAPAASLAREEVAGP